MSNSCREWLNRELYIGKWVFRVSEVLFLCAMFLLGTGIRAAFLPYVSQDYTGYWDIWFEEIHKYGGMKSLAYDFYDYAPTFMYFLVWVESLPFDPMYTYKIVMSVIDIAAAVSSALLVKEISGSGQKAVLTAGMVFLLPTVMANSALWCQCDVIYTTLLLFALYFFIKERPMAAMICVSLSFCLKLQTLFVFPALVIFWVFKKVKVEHFFLLPAFYVISIIPAWIAGRPFLDLIKVYFAQGNTDVWALTLSWPNIYEILTPQALIPIYSGMGKCMVLVVLMCTMYYMARRRYELTPELMVQMYLFFAMVSVYFLPFMHERYGYIADILAVIYAVYRPKRFFIPLCHVLISYASYTSFLTKAKPVPMILYALILLGLIMVVGADIYKNMHQTNKTEDAIYAVKGEQV